MSYFERFIQKMMAESGVKEDSRPGKSCQGRDTDEKTPVTDGGAATASGVWSELGETADVTDCSVPTLVGSLLEGLAHPAYIVDAEGTITHVNEEVSKLYGHETSDESVGVNVSEYDDEGRVLMQDVLENGETVTDSEEWITEGGSEVLARRTILPLYDENHEIVGALEILRDVSERERQRKRKEKLVEYQRRAIENLRQDLTALGEGDLTIEPEAPQPEDSFDEINAIHETFQEMSDDLSRGVRALEQMVYNLQMRAESLTDASESLSDATASATERIEGVKTRTDSLSDGASAVASRSSEADQATNELSSAIEEITASSKQISNSSEEAAERTRNGVEEITDSLVTIRDATESTESVADGIEQLQETMVEVSESVESIAEIAEQTNMLALNANIEAARADGDGEGFAVVADEIKTLAVESRESADEIADVVENIQQQTESLARDIRVANDDVADGADAVEGAVETFETIETRIDETVESIAEIADAVDSQATNTEEVTATIEQTAELATDIEDSVTAISTSVERQSETIQEVTVESRRLDEIGADLRESVSEFEVNRVDDKGRTPS